MSSSGMTDTWWVITALDKRNGCMFLSLPLCASPRVSHWSDASTSRQRHASEEQQPFGHHCGLCRSCDRGGGGGGGLDLHTPLFGSAEKVRL